MIKYGLLFTFPLTVFSLHSPFKKWVKFKVFSQVIRNPLPADVDTGLDTIGCDDDGTDSSGNLMTGLACEMVSSSGKAVIRGPLVAENDQKAHRQG